MILLSNRIARALCAGFLMMLASAAGAQSAANFPNRNVHVIVPYAPGGLPSIMMLGMTDRFFKEMGQRLIVENVPGGDTIIGTTRAVKSPPDGHTLLIVTSTYIVNYWLNPDLPFNTLKELSPISTLSTGELVLAVHPSFPARTLKEFVSVAKANPGKVNMSYPGSIGLLTYQLFMNATGIKIQPVAYKGGAEAVTALYTGDVEGNINSVPQLVGPVNAGKLRGLAITGNKRSPVLPNVPTFAEVGVPKFEGNNWQALLIPSRTPRDIVEKLNAFVRRAQEAPEVTGAWAKLNVNPFPQSVDESERFVQKETDRLGKLIKESGLKRSPN